MTFLEKNFHEMCAIVEEEIKEAKKDKSIRRSNYVIMHVTYEDFSFKYLHSKIIPSRTGNIHYDSYLEERRSIVISTKNIDEVFDKFRIECLKEITYAEVINSINVACIQALTTENGEYTYKQTFHKPSIEGFQDAYRDTIYSTNLKNMACWLSFDEAFENVEIQVDRDLMNRFGEFKREDFYL